MVFNPHWASATVEKALFPTLHLMPGPYLRESINLGWGVLLLFHLKSPGYLNVQPQLRTADLVLSLKTGAGFLECSKCSISVCWLMNEPPISQMRKWAQTPEATCLGLTGSEVLGAWSSDFLSRSSGLIFHSSSPMVSSLVIGRSRQEHLLSWFVRSFLWPRP